MAPLTRVSHVGSARPFFAAGPADSAFVNRIVVTVCRAPYEHSGFWAGGGVWFSRFGLLMGLPCVGADRVGFVSVLQVDEGVRRRGRSRWAVHR